MAESFFFYDLETSGFDPRRDRIMQFAGQRTDLSLKPIGEPVNVLIKLTPDTLPSPDAILVTKITPQQTIADGVTESEFLKLFHEQVATPGTVFVGFNSIRFDDEFMRFLHYRNFYDAYEWQWQDGKTRWDLLDLVRMTRALRPEGIKWPFDSEGKPANRLELLAAANKLIHTKAHDALSDVEASIALARLIRKNQPRLFDYLLSLRTKTAVAEFVSAQEMFIYTSGKYANEFEKTTVVSKLVDHPNRAAVLVYDLRHDPSPFLSLSADKLAEIWQYQKDATEPRLPVKTLQFNRCPALAPLSVLDSESKSRLGISLDKCSAHKKQISDHPDFVKNILKALDMLDRKQQQRLMGDEQEADIQLYDGFIKEADKSKMSVVRAADKSQIADLDLSFIDSRLQKIFPLYKARNFPGILSGEEAASWEHFCAERLTVGNSKSRVNQFMQRIESLSQDAKQTKENQFILEELRLYAESILPTLS